MPHEQRVRAAERRLFESAGLTAGETFIEAAGAPVRVLSIGDGPGLVMLHGVSLAAAVWAPWLTAFAGYRVHLADLPGHGLSGAVDYRPGMVREHAVTLVDDLLDALGLDCAPVIGHSLGGMFALWHAVARPGRIGSLALTGAPAVALPGAVARMPLALMTVPVLGPAVLRSPAPRPVYRVLFAQGMSQAAAAAAPGDLLDALRFAVRRPASARSIGAVMHALNRFRQPRPGSTLTEDELRGIAVPVLFCWGSGDPFLPAAAGRPWAELLPAATFREVAGGHGPWLDDPAGCAGLVTRHLRETGFPPAS
jgi:pimeloyl-ACP methyl ester carboxylesterase